MPETVIKLEMITADPDTRAKQLLFKVSGIEDGVELTNAPYSTALNRLLLPPLGLASIVYLQKKKRTKAHEHIENIKVLWYTIIDCL